MSRQLYDLLLGKQTIQGGGQLKKAIMQHKNALVTQLARMKIKAGVQSNEELLPLELRSAGVLEPRAVLMLTVSSGQVPRFARVNRLKATTTEIINRFQREGFVLSDSSNASSASSYAPTKNVESKASSSDKPRSFRVDDHVPDLLVFPPHTGLSFSLLQSAHCL